MTMRLAWRSTLFGNLEIQHLESDIWHCDAALGERRLLMDAREADCQSAIQQTTCLRYEARN
jgi:hypothetical protein